MLRADLEILSFSLANKWFLGPHSKEEMERSLLRPKPRSALGSTEASRDLERDEDLSISSCSANNRGLVRPLLCAGDGLVLAAQKETSPCPWPLPTVSRLM